MPGTACTALRFPGPAAARRRIAFWHSPAHRPVPWLSTSVSCRQGGTVTGGESLGAVPLPCYPFNTVASDAVESRITILLDLLLILPFADDLARFAQGGDHGFHALPSLPPGGSEVIWMSWFRPEPDACSCSCSSVQT